MQRIIAYARVSTRQQGASGLGLEAQVERMTAFAAQNGLHIEASYEEVETGRGSDALDLRPVLKAALAHAQKLKCALLVAKLDRLSRDVSFISALMARKTPFIVAELGRDTNNFMLHIHAAVAEQERNVISERTRAALRAKRARGELLGNRKNFGEAQALGRKAQAAEARDRAQSLAPVLAELRQAGVTSFLGIAEALNARGIATPQGLRWHAASVARVARRLEALAT
jgi:DNA invertase Pin-like site-specific DNA recombinase